MLRFRHGPTSTGQQPALIALIEFKFMLVVFIALSQLISSGASTSSLSHSNFVVVVVCFGLELQCLAILCLDWISSTSFESSADLRCMPLQLCTSH